MTVFPEVIITGHSHSKNSYTLGSTMDTKGRQDRLSS